MGVTKVELFEIIRKEHFQHQKSIRQIARAQRVHRRLVRQALLSGNAHPSSNKTPTSCPTVNEQIFA